MELTAAVRVPEEGETCTFPFVRLSTAFSELRPQSCTFMGWRAPPPPTSESSGTDSNKEVLQ